METQTAWTKMIKQYKNIFICVPKRATKKSCRFERTRGRVNERMNILFKIHQRFHGTLKNPLFLQRTES